MTQECGVFKSYAPQPDWVQGQNYRGGPPDAREKSSGLINAVDVSTGKIRWRSAMPYPPQGGALVTSTAYLLAQNCVKPSGAKDTFPATDRPVFSKVTLVGGACAAGSSPASGSE